MTNKILITGKPGAGKSIYAKYLKFKLKNTELIEFDECNNINDFINKIRSVSNEKNLIAVIQSEDFIKGKFNKDFFNRKYECLREGFKSFYISDGIIKEEWSFKNMYNFFDKKLDIIFERK